MRWASVRVGGIAVLAALLLGLLALLAWGPGAGRPHDVPVGIVAPGLTGELLAESVAGTSGELVPVDVEDADEALDLLADGEVTAVVDVDLSRTEDVIWIDPGRNPDLLDAVVARIQAVEHHYGRTARVQEAPSSRDGRYARIDWATLAAVVAGAVMGLAVAGVRWLRRVPIAGLPRTALALVPGAWLIAAVLVSVPALDTGHPWWFAGTYLALVAGIAAGISVTCVAASPGYGAAVALGLQLTMLAPVLNGVAHAMLPQPWRFLYPLTPVGAARSALTFTTDEWVWRTLLVMLVWLVGTAVAGRRAVRRSSDWHDELPLLRTAAPVLPAVAALVVITLLLPTGPPDDQVDQVLATTTECIDPGPVETVADLNRIAQLRGRDVFGGADVGASAQLQDGRTVWLFGDTVSRDPASGRSRFTRNSMLVMDPGCIQVLLMPGQGAVIPDRDSEVGYWPMSVTVSQAQGYDLVTVMAQRVAATGTGGWDFANLGPSVAAYVVPVGGVPQLMAVRDAGDDTVDRTRPMWGAASTEHDGWLYLYGTASPGEHLVFGFSLSVARVRPDEVLDVSAWRYFDGSEWVKDPTQAVELIDAESGTSQTLSVWESEGTWYALSKRDEYLGSEVVVWTAPGPTGPFTAQAPVKDLPSDLEGGRLRYMPLAHPELLPREGTVVVSWSNNQSDPQAVIDDPLLYRPAFARVALPSP
ncbi:MAG: DUF4185 domain-containing protein [Nocardioides sp.]|uniref:DUF4185 domain-containing protein n=1 Tax=Nocardioides sp. TaxID=35761 RepID=UPI003F0819C8